MELTAEWDLILALGPVYPVTLDDLSAGCNLGIGAFFDAAAGIHRRLGDFIHQVLVHRRDEAIREWRNWLREDPLVHPYRWLRPDLVPPAPFLQCEPHLTPDGSGVISDPNQIDAEFRKAWLPYFCRFGQRDTSLEEFDFEVEEWLPLLPEVSLPRLTGSLDIEEVLAGAADSHVHLFVADVIKSFDTVDRGILDRVLSSFGLPRWFRHAYFEYHAHVRFRFKLASGLGQSWTRDGGIPQGCPLSMMFIVALYLPWCRYLGAQCGVSPQLYADNLKCVSRYPGLLFRAARCTTDYVRLVGQEPAPSKCVLLSTFKAVRSEMRGWVLSDEGDRWTVKLDVRDLDWHLDTTRRGWSSTLSTWVRLVMSRLDLVFALHVYSLCSSRS